jgi:hypothetical protein
VSDDSGAIPTLQERLRIGGFIAALGCAYIVPGVAAERAWSRWLTGALALLAGLWFLRVCFFGLQAIVTDTPFPYALLLLLWLVGLFAAVGLPSVLFLRLVVRSHRVVDAGVRRPTSDCVVKS